MSGKNVTGNQDAAPGDGNASHASPDNNKTEPETSSNEDK